MTNKPDVQKDDVEAIRQRAENATPNIFEEEPHRIRGRDLPSAGSRVYSPHVGMRFERDYQLFLHAREDILSLLAQNAALGKELEEAKERIEHLLNRALESEQNNRETTEELADEKNAAHMWSVTDSITIGELTAANFSLTQALDAAQKERDDWQANYEDAIAQRKVFQAHLEEARRENANLIAITKENSEQFAREFNHLDNITKREISELTSRIKELQTEKEKLQKLNAELDKSESQLIDDRDRAQDALQETHIALGGDGEWVGRTYHVDPPDSGDLHLDVPVLAAQIFSQASTRADREKAIRFATIVFNNFSEPTVDDWRFAYEPDAKCAADFLTKAKLLERHSRNGGWFRWLSGTAEGEKR